MQQLAVPPPRWWIWSLWARTAMPEVSPPLASDDDVLTAVLAEPPGCERRGTIRHLCGRLTRCRFISLFQCPAWPAFIHDISTTGIGLIVDEPPVPGTFLTVELNERQRVGVQVVALRPLEMGDWLIGCVQLRPLSIEQLEDLI